MKIFSAAGPPDRVTARNCFLVNQFATPGLGSLMGGRWVAGIGQLLLAVAGFVLVIAWFVLVMIREFGSLSLQDNSATTLPAHLGEAGGLTFAASWLWALVTSLSLLRDSKKPGDPGSGGVPPRIDDPGSQKPDGSRPT
jgi:hypothetical protein